MDLLGRRLLSADGAKETFFGGTFLDWNNNETFYNYLVIVLRVRAPYLAKG
jgi:hypothetical protein